MGKGLFITGTGTEVGKTVVTAGILRYLRGQGVDAMPMKPVQTGAVASEEGWRAPDLDFHFLSAGIRVSRKQYGVFAPYCYGPACSPHLAGRERGEYPDIARISASVQGLVMKYEALLIEGAGGIMVPLDESRTNLDLMKALGCPVLLVAHAGLGTINHTLLSLGALRGAGLEVVGVVFNEVTPVGEDYIKADNPDAVSRFGAVEVLGRIPYCGDVVAEDESFWKTFEESMPGLSKLLTYFREEGI